MDTTQRKNDRHNLEPETLQDLQVCLYDWQNYNFGKQDNERVLLGICEEAGELCHAQLKGEQDIRGDKKKHDEEMIDAIGDMMIYSMNYLSGMKAKFPSFTAREDVEKVDESEESGVKVVRRAVLSAFRMAGKIVESPNQENLVRQLVHHLAYLCALKGWDLEKIVRLTWKVEVAPRDWKKFPKNGRAPEAPAAAAPIPNGAPAAQPTA